MLRRCSSVAASIDRTAKELLLAVALKEFRASAQETHKIRLQTTEGHLGIRALLSNRILQRIGLRAIDANMKQLQRAESKTSAELLPIADLSCSPREAQDSRAHAKKKKRKTSSTGARGGFNNSPGCH